MSRWFYNTFGSPDRPGDGSPSGDTTTSPTQRPQPWAVDGRGLFVTVLLTCATPTAPRSPCPGRPDRRPVVSGRCPRPHTPLLWPNPRTGPTLDLGDPPRPPLKDRGYGRGDVDRLFPFRFREDSESFRARGRPLLHVRCVSRTSLILHPSSPTPRRFSPTRLTGAQGWGVECESQPQ